MCGLQLYFARAKVADIFSVILALYSKEVGAGSLHAWKKLTNSIGAISHTVAQMYETSNMS